MQRIIGSIALLSILFVGSAQSPQKISLALDKASVTDAMEEFSAQTGYRFAYNPDILRNDHISVDLRDVSIDKALASTFTNYDYKIRGSYVVLLPKNIKSGSSERIQSVTVQGEVLEEGTGKKLENVTVYEIINLKPVLTNASGSYQIDVSLPEEMTYLAISKENYQDTVIQVKKNSIWSISLKPKNEPKEEKENSIFDRLNNEKVQTHANNVNLTERRLFHLALTPGLSTNGFLSGQFTNKLSFNLIAGYSYALEGVELGGFLNMERSYVSGTQLSGALNINGDYMSGVQMAGFSNITMGYVDGVQMAGFSNHSRNQRGLQMAGALNTAKDVTGTQMSGSVNISTGELTGVQLSGFLNYTKVLRGVQIGVLNVADSISSGFSLGVVNWLKGGLHHFEVSSNDITPYNLAFKSGVYPFYTILRVGVNPHDGQLWDHGMGFGSMHPIKKRGFIDFEGTYHMIQGLNTSYINGVNFEARFQVRVGWKITDHLNVIGGPVLHFYMLNPNNKEHLSFADRFGKNPLFGSETTEKVSKSWLGYEVAIRF
ncbi:MAG: STN domain-containing protein [Marinoscillum sp.]